MEKNGEKFPIESTPEFARLTCAGRAMELPADPEDTEEESQSLPPDGSFEFFGISNDGIRAMIVGLGEVESNEDESCGDEVLGIEFEVGFRVMKLINKDEGNVSRDFREGSGVDVFKPSTVAIGAAIICAWILKPKDDFRVDNLSKSSDYFEDGSSVYANWEEGSPKAFGWRFTLEGLRACVDYGHPSPTEEELMIEYRMYDESSRDVGDIVTFGLCEYCDLFICSRRRKARCWICWYKVMEIGLSAANLTTFEYGGNLVKFFLGSSKSGKAPFLGSQRR
ncbi:hypothetical protein RHSIM_Rhsim07G0125900 [Rhododendron simsii]|uniref:Uncharacterized protein n=1 Tax=Rhododendron simsii TaxID=118357 RepID=A0A834GQN8_RHOSS|nr:hypothetical protein RHSIM_Rhsim07G0125900 [Rhododendron simsii]